MNSATQKLVDAFKKKEIRALTKLISLAENEDPESRLALEALAGSAQARVVGVTGPPGAGKSSLVSHFIETLRAQKKRVAVLAVDPTSPLTGGAVLGDRIRLTAHFNDPDVFIRSVSTRGRLGGISLATPQSIALVEAFGFDYLFVESVGVGQNEHEISRWTDVTLLVLTPDSGDGIQAIKAGVLEMADLIVVNKNEDGRGEAMYRELEATFKESPKKAGRSSPVLCLSTEKDPESRKQVVSAIEGWFGTNQKVREDRRLAFPKRLCHALIINHLNELVATWTHQQDFSKASPFALFRAFKSGIKLP